MSPTLPLRTDLRTALRWFAGALALRLVLFAIDHHYRFFLGDSGSYLATEIGGWIPPDRSWMYGLSINWLLRATRHLESIQLVQICATSALCAGAALQCRELGARNSLCVAALLVLSLDPLSIWSERSIMSDTPAAATAWLGMVLALRSLRGGGVGESVAAALCLFAAVVLRTAILPIALAACALVFAARLWSGRASAPKLRGAAAALALPALMGVLLIGYARVTGHLAGYPPSLNPAAGGMLLGTVAPLVEPQDFAGLGVRDPVALLSDPMRRERSERNCQVFCPDGLDLRLLAQLHDLPATTRIAGIAAQRSILRNPSGFLRLYLDNLIDYATPRMYRQVFDETFGLNRPLDDGLIASLHKKTVDEVTASSPSVPSPALDWLRALWFWPALLTWLALGVPLWALARLRTFDNEQRAPIAILALVALGYTASIFFFSLEVLPRFLLPVTPFLAVLVALGVEHALRPAPPRLRDSIGSR